MPRTLSYFKTRKRTEPDWIIPGWLKRKNTGFIIGQPKRACKSWLLLNLAWDLSAGSPVWGIERARDGYLFVPPRPMRVIYFTQEDAEDDIHDRIDICFKGGRTDNPNLYIVPKDLKLTLDNLIHIESPIKSAAESGPIDLIIFDPMRRMHYGKENDSDVIVKLWQSLDILHERYNCSTLFSHHMVKPPRDAASSHDQTSPHAARGSGDIYGGGDAFINVIPRPVRGRNAATRDLDLHFETKRSRATSPLILSISFDTGAVTFKGFLEGRDAQKRTKNEVNLKDLDY